MHSSSLRALTGCIVLASLGLAGCALTDSTGPGRAKNTVTALPEPSSGEGDRVLSFDFDDLPGADETDALLPEDLTLRNAGLKQFKVGVSTLAGGRLHSVRDFEGGRALRFPAYLARGRQRAVVTVFSTSVTDPLGPGTSRFTFGADFNLNARSDGSGFDDGNNMIQRGLSDDPAQYKLQVDQGRVSCFVAGDAGELLVRAKTIIRPDTWYHASCSRSDRLLTLELGTLDGPRQHVVGSGPTGAVYVPVATPLVLGGKASSTGEVVAGEADQFNGALDNVFLDVDQDS